jgi:glycosyltransferase involved in cell wall biosynthesis
VDQHLLDKLGENTYFHLELGAGQFPERDLLIKLIHYGFKNINITLHDPPFLTFPFYRFSIPLLNQPSRGFDWYFNTFGATKRVLIKCRNIYVLSQKGKRSVESRYGLTNVQYIPHIVDPEKVETIPLDGTISDILFFGFIGPKKGLDYALRLHAEIQKISPGIKLHVIGEATAAKAAKYFESLKSQFHSGVIYHGFVPESELDGIFNQVAHVFLPFQEYGYLCPASGSVLNALRRGKIVWTNPVNAIGEVINDEMNGLFFASDIDVDAKRFISLSSSVSDVCVLSESALATARASGTENVAFKMVC